MREAQLCRFFRRREQLAPPSSGKRSRKLELSEEVDWWIWRIVTSDRIRGDLISIQTEWSIDDVLDAHFVLNAFAEAEADAEREADRGRS